MSNDIDIEMMQRQIAEMTTQIDALLVELQPLWADRNQRVDSGDIFGVNDMNRDVIRPKESRMRTLVKSRQGLLDILAKPGQ